MKSTRFFIIALGLFAAFGIEAAPKKYYMNQDKKSNQALDEMHNLIDDMKYEASNHEAEIRIFEEKLNNQEVAVDSLWKQLHDLTQVNKEKLKDHMSVLESKLMTLEKSTYSTTHDIEKLKNHANDSSNALTQYTQKITNLEKIVEVQNQNIDHLQAALHALMEALQIKDVALETEDPYHINATVYQVKPGDSLDKIARKHHTSVHRLRELNHLTGNNDLIIVGQKLKLPESA